jgi:hypothetical protein
MADKNSETRVTQSAQDAPGGVEGTQVEPTTSLTKDVKQRMTFTGDADLHPSSLEHAADRTSLPGPEYPPLERPPVSTTRPDREILRSLVTGAGAHTPPDPDKYDAEGRPRDVA